MFCLINHLYSQGIDMRKGVEGLCSIIRTYQYGPTNQEVYVFANKSRSLVKMLHWERGVVFLENLLIDCNILIFNTCESGRTSKETNWKQTKFQKTKMKTSVNMENKRNFHFLSSCRI